MNNKQRTITCLSSHLQQVLLVRSLVGIVSHNKEVEIEWVYSDEDAVDIIIVDYDDDIDASSYQKSIVIGFTRSEDLLSTLPYGLHKPLRSRDFLELLVRIEREKFTHAKVNESDQSHAFHPNIEVTGVNNPLDAIMSFMRDAGSHLIKIRFDEQQIYIDPTEKKVYFSAGFDFLRAARSLEFTYHYMTTMPNEKFAVIGLTDFFYQYSLRQMNTALLSGINQSMLFKLKQWPQFINPQNAKSVMRIAAYFSKHNASIEKAANDLALGFDQLIGFINAVYAQNILVYEAVAPVAIKAPVSVPIPVVQSSLSMIPKEPEPKKEPTPEATSGLKGLFGRIRSKFGL